MAEFKLWTTEIDDMVHFRGSYSRSELLAADFDPLDKLIMRKEAVSNSDYLLALEIIFRRIEEAQQRAKQAGVPDDDE